MRPVGLDEEIALPHAPALEREARATSRVLDPDHAEASGRGQAPELPAAELAQEAEGVRALASGPEDRAGVHRESGKVRAEHELLGLVLGVAVGNASVSQVPGGSLVQEPLRPSRPDRGHGADLQEALRSYGSGRLHDGAGPLHVDGALQRRVCGPVADDRRVVHDPEGQPGPLGPVGGRAEGSADRVGLGQVTGHALEVEPPEVGVVTALAAGRPDFVPRGRQLAAEGAPEEAVGPRHEDGRGHRCSPAAWSGSARRATAPRASSRLRSETCPPRSSTTRRTMARPSPVPLERVVK